MQQPKIMFGNKQMDVICINYHNKKPSYVIALEDGQALEFVDIKDQNHVHREKCHQIDLEKSLIYSPSTIEDMVEGIKRKIEAHEEVICDMSLDFVESFREARKAPFASGDLFEKADLIEKLGYVVDGLHEALGVILNKGDCID